MEKPDRKNFQSQDSYDKAYDRWSERQPRAETTTPAPVEAAPAKTTRPPVDSTELRQLTMAYAKAIMHGSVPESSQAWGALILHIEQWGEA